MVLSVGHIAFRKGQHVLAEAFARIARKFPDWNLWIVGHNAESACWDYIEEIIQRPGLKERIRLVGPTGKPEELMRRTSIFVQPSRWEALGLALQEALYYGCPSVGTAVGGIPELIDDGVNGLLIPPDDSAAMAAALEKLLTDEAMRRRFSEAAPKSIIGKGMTSDIMASEYLALYRSSTQPMETFQ
jgi:glycosyltransferase involved in cell wall biosynthesis